MTPMKPGQRIRKVWLPSEMKKAVADYCWKHRTKPSPFVVDILHQIIEDHEQFTEPKRLEAGLNYISIYVDDATWDLALEIADGAGMTLGAMIRVGMAAVLAEEGIPWHGSGATVDAKDMPDQA